MPKKKKEETQLIPVTANPLETKPLNAKERKFVESYVEHMNATKAAIAAGYSAKSASTTAYKLRRKPHIAAEIHRLQAELKAKSGINSDSVYLALARIATCDMTEFAEWDKNGVYFKDSKKLPPGAGMLVKEIAQTKDGPRLKLEDRVQALVRLGQENGMFVRKVDARLGRLPEEEMSEAELIRIAQEGDE